MQPRAESPTHWDGKKTPRYCELELRTDTSFAIARSDRMGAANTRRGPTFVAALSESPAMLQGSYL